MGNKCIGEVDIFAAKDGIYVSDPSCYVVGSDVVKYSKKSTTIDGVTTVTYIDGAGVETASLPVGAEQIDCDDVVYLGNPSAGGSSNSMPIAPNCNGDDAALVFDPCVLDKLDLIIEAINQAAMDNIKSVVQYQAQIESLANGQSAFYDYTMALDASKTYTFSLTGYAAYPLVQATVSQQDPTTVRVVVENQSGDVIPATQIIITATSV